MHLLRPPSSPPRAAALATALAVMLGAAAGCAIPCDQVRDDADRRLAAIGDGLRRAHDPGGDGYDVTLLVPDALIDASFQRLLDDGTIDTEQEQVQRLPIPGVERALSVALEARLTKAHLSAVPGDPARVRVDARLRLRGSSGGDELFDLDAEVSGPVELISGTSDDGSPALYVRMGDLEATQMDLAGEILGRAFRAEIEGLLPRGGLGRLLGSVGLDEEIERALDEAVRGQLEALLQQLFDDRVGDVLVLDLGTLDLGGLPVAPTAVGLRTGDGWIAMGLRTDLDTGAGAIDLTPAASPRRDRILLRMSEAFVGRAIQLAYVEGLIPRSFGEQGQPAEDGVYRAEPLGIDLADPARVAVKVSRCSDPCGWAEISASIEASVSGDQLDLRAGEVTVDRSRGSGRLMELVLWHQERVVGEPVEVVQSMSRVIAPRVGGKPLTMRVTDIDLLDDELTVELGYEIPPLRKPGQGRGKARSGGGSAAGKPGRSSAGDSGSRRTTGGGKGRR